MKHLKSKSSDLRRMFERAICIRDIAEPLVSFDADRNPDSILSVMNTRIWAFRRNGSSACADNWPPALLTMYDLAASTTRIDAVGGHSAALLRNSA